MTAQRKGRLLWAGLAATLLLVWFAPGSEMPAKRDSRPVRDARAMPIPAATADAAVTTAATNVGKGSLVKAERRQPGDVPDLFKAATWYVPPPPPQPPPPPPPPPPPSAPALPFTFLGQVIEDQRPQFILVRGDRVVTVAVGDSIDKNYRLESLQNGTLTFVYVPLDTRQTLVTGVSQ